MEKSSIDQIRRGYSEDELHHIYELGRLFAETGQVRRAEKIFIGLTEIAPNFLNGWLGLGYTYTYHNNYVNAHQAALQAVKINENSVEAMMLLAVVSMILGDFNSAGTYLGEVGEKIENGAVAEPNLVRLYKTQVARFETRR